MRLEDPSPRWGFVIHKGLSLEATRSIRNPSETNPNSWYLLMQEVDVAVFVAAVRNTTVHMVGFLSGGLGLTEAGDGSQGWLWSSGGPRSRNN